MKTLIRKLTVVKVERMIRYAKQQIRVANNNATYTWTEWTELLPELQMLRDEVLYELHFKGEYKTNKFMTSDYFLPQF